ncbi:MAG: NADAR family protein [Candidatus Thiodiazotropha sp.]
MNIRSRSDLINYLNQGNRAKYLFFWGHQKPKSGVSKTCLSQWYDAAFELDGIKYQTAEHYMMAEKARLFGDMTSEEKVITAITPGEAKKIGRSVKGFDEALWLEKRFSIVVAANHGKFGQNNHLKEFLLGTNNRVLVEASPLDKIWGIGLAADDQRAENPNLWKGENLLGFALMEVRSSISEVNS